MLNSECCMLNGRWSGFRIQDCGFTIQNNLLSGLHNTCHHLLCHSLVLLFFIELSEY